HLLAHDHTLKWFREEQYIPNKIIDRSTNEEWINKGRKTVIQRATEEVDELLKKYSGVSLDKDKVTSLIKIMSYKDIDFKELLEM
ncbi:MAG: trimethylamine methyltransferase family protein, partial [Candidatus Heimdallarchaeaceae archaeon]